jgi:hypothetical protein
MGQVRWAGWTMAIATVLVISGAQVARGDITSDKPAAIVLYTDIDVFGDAGRDTIVRLTNTNQTTPILVHCFYVDANSHCSGGFNDGAICTDNPGACTGLGFCIPGWLEVDFRAHLTPNQPIEWKAGDGLADDNLPLPVGVCVRNPLRTCGSDADCNPFPGGVCTFSNQGTRIPPVPEDPFVGELRCIAIDSNGNPVPRNDLKGEWVHVTAQPDWFNVASANAIGIQATGVSTGATNELVLGGPDAEYNGCPNYLILNHFFDEAENPVPGSSAHITTELTLVPCSADYLRQIPGSAVAQYLVFNEFEQRFSTSRAVRCWQEIQLCNIDTPNCSRSIFNVAVSGTLTGQTRINAIPIGAVPSALLGSARESHDGMAAEFNLHMQGARDTSDIIIIP